MARTFSATDNDRELAEYIRTVAAACLSECKSRLMGQMLTAHIAALVHAKVLDCMASIISGHRNGTSAEELGREIAEHG